MKDLLLLVIAALTVTRNAFAEIHEIPTKCPESSGKTVQLAHKHDCTKFYECSNGQKLLSNCPEFAPGQKLHFDPELQNCTFPWEANCASRAPDCSKDEFIQPHPTNCSLYYKCENGEKVLKTCDEEQLFCSESLECVDKDAAKCKVYDSCPTGKLLEAVLLPHDSHSQSLYYECVDGQYAARRCPSGHVFDNERRQCVTHVDICRNETCTNDMFFLNQNCNFSSDCQSDRSSRYPHESDCTLFYECSDGRKCLMPCFEGHVFNPVIGSCDLPENVPNCHDYIPTSTTTTWRPTATTSTTWRPPATTSTTTRPTTTTTTTWRPPYCIEGNKMPHECNCYAYYVCRHGEYQWMRCSTGEMFDWAERKCMPQNIAECRPSGNNGCQGSCSSSSDLLPHRECNKYCTCDHGTTTVRTCGPHTYYDRFEGRCNWPEDIRDLPAYCDPTDCSFGINYVPHDCYCDRYYDCSGDGKFLQECKPGKDFDYREEKCVDRKDAHCYTKI